MVAVFGYGSLIAPATIAELGGHHYARARLTGWSLSWNVCTDNGVNKSVVYEDPADGTRPPIQVLFLAVEPGVAVEGVVIHLPDDGLPALDAREGNYLRVAVEVDGHGPAWTYVARPRSAERARQGIAAGTARIRKEYLDTLVAAYAAHEGMSLPRPLPAPVADLVRVRL
jgi:cation transport regulator ChaC